MGPEICVTAEAPHGPAQLPAKGIELKPLAVLGFLKGSFKGVCRVPPRDTSRALGSGVLDPYKIIVLKVWLKPPMDFEVTRRKKYRL